LTLRRKHGYNRGPFRFFCATSAGKEPPINDALAREFASPGSAWRSKPFWSWNGDLDPEELRRQIRVMRRMGMGGFFMHARVGLVTPYLSPRWFECIRACVDEARKLKMEAWLYDEDRWPAGSAGGLVTKNRAWRQRMLRLVESDDPKAFRWTPNTLAAFTAVIEGHAAFAVRQIPKGGRVQRLAKGERILAFRVELPKPLGWYNDQTYLDALNPAAVREFIRVTHEAYRRECGRRFAKVIPGVFNDESNGGECFVEPINASESHASDTLPWTDALPKVFRERYGYDLLPRLPELAYDLEGQGIRPARYHFHDCVSHLYVTAFSKQIGEWCGRHRLRLTGHVLEEDSLSQQVATASACMRFYEYMQTPGLDMLTERWRVYDAAKQVSSVARQLGRKWRLTETDGATGWDFSFAGHKALGNWQVALGINARCPHLYWYTMLGQAKRDWPASIGEQSPWWKHWATVEDYFARLHVALTPGQEVRDILVIHPVESVWLQVRKDWQRPRRLTRFDGEFGKLRDTLLSAHLDFDYGDEELLSRHASVVSRGPVPALRVGRASYKAVVVPPMTTMRRTTLNLLEKFREAGGRVVFAGKPAAYVEAIRDPGPAKLAERCARTSARGPKLAAALDPLCRRASITDAAGKEIAGVLYLLREDREGFRLFICNTGYTAAELQRLGFNEDRRVCNRRAAWPTVRIQGFAECAGAPQEWDPSTGRRFAANATRMKRGPWEIVTDLPRLGSRLFVMPKAKVRESLPARPAFKSLRTLPLAAGAWEIGLSEKNVLVLDRAQYLIRGKAGKGEGEILRLDQRVRRALGVPARGSNMVQPWARRRQVGKKKSIPVALEYRIHVDVLPQEELLLGLESPHRFAIAINGRPVSLDAKRGWWVDPSLKLLALAPAWLRVGENRLRLETGYTEDDGLEIVYLLGHFGVRIASGEARIVAAPERLKIGDWTRQGLPFYSGSVTYRRAVAAPKLAKGERLFVRVPEYRGVAARVLVDGKEAGFIGWEPAEADITDYVQGDAFELGIEVLSHRRNSHGPLHYAEKWPVFSSPWHFESEGKDWSANWNLVPCGLMEMPGLEIRRISNVPR
jgi:hypothetical protein